MQVQQYIYWQDYRFTSCEPKEEWPHAGLYNYKDLS